MSLAGRFLALQLTIIVVVLAAVAALSLAQADQQFRGNEGRRLLSVAETAAATPALRVGLERDFRDSVAAIAEGVRGVSGASYVTIVGVDRRVIASPDPAQIGRPLPLGGAPERSWVGVRGHDLIAHVPVIGDRHTLVGVVVTGRTYPTWWERLRAATPYALIYLGIAGLIGLAGSFLLARRIKRQTFGMEPQEIAGLVEQREAVLHGIKEGVLSVDLTDRVTLANDEAVRLLGLPADCVGHPLEGRLRELLTEPGEDRIVVFADRVLTLNRMPVSSRGRHLGWVITLRDRTELVALRRELDVTRHTSDALRAQAHEFTNRMHTISGLLELGEYDEVARFVTGTSQAHERLSAQITDRLADPSLAALLIAKASLAAERGVAFSLVEGSVLGRLDEQLSADLVTVAGNLIDNALDALGAAPGGRITLEVRDTGGDDDASVVIGVRDSGPGVAAEPAEAVFAQGFSTKRGDERGLGLAIARMICTRRGGSITVHNDGGAVFTARLPVRERPPARREADQAGRRTGWDEPAARPVSGAGMNGGRR
ncbi:sensor histidine kinase [Actinomadura alba]|uniref:histidine kinase n=1 Tax=Actinomadura alba TaxID=406431 RepID=A0ABR7M0B0_9ACTN|nr:sensor histidine kinase [Actinomadura alba]